MQHALLALSARLASGWRGCVRKRRLQPALAQPDTPPPPAPLLTCITHRSEPHPHRRTASKRSMPWRRPAARRRPKPGARATPWQPPHFVLRLNARLRLPPSSRPTWHCCPHSCILTAPTSRHFLPSSPFSLSSLRPPNTRRRLAAELRAAGLSAADLVVYASPFSRALETARLAAAAAGGDAAAVQVGGGGWRPGGAAGAGAAAPALLPTRCNPSPNTPTPAHLGNTTVAPPKPPKQKGRP